MQQTGYFKSTNINTKMKNRILLIILIILISSIVGYFIYSIRTVKITSTGDKQIDNLITNLQKSMEDYMKDSKPSYSQKRY